MQVQDQQVRVRSHADLSRTNEIRPAPSPFGAPETNIKLFSTGTPVSVIVWTRKVGGVSGETWSSFEYCLTRSSDGF